MMGAVSHETADENTKRLSHKKSVHLLFFLVVGDIKLPIVISFNDSSVIGISHDLMIVALALF
jgi:hypothetical protein